MTFDPARHHRRSIRLKGYDYSRVGAYFVTACIYRRECLLGEVVNDEMVLNEYGRVIWDEWFRSAKIRREIELDEFMVLQDFVWVEELGFKGHQDFLNYGSPLLVTDSEERNHERQRALCSDSWTE